MNLLDRLIVALYMAGMIAMSVFLGRSQKKEKDYYLGGNRTNLFAIYLSTMATQCSTNSLLGAPAFVIAVGWLVSPLFPARKAQGEIDDLVYHRNPKACFGYKWNWPLFHGILAGYFLLLLALLWRIQPAIA